MAKTVRQKEINFLTVLVGSRGKKTINLRSLLIPGALLLVILAGAGAFAYLHVTTTHIEEDSGIIREFLNSPELNRQLTQASSLSDQTSQMESQAQSATIPMENLGTFPDLSSAQYQQILDFAGVNITLNAMSFDRTTGILQFAASSDYVLSIPTFISQLRTSGIFSDVSYAGYSGSAAPSSILSNSTDREDGSVFTAPAYSFSVQCSVKPPAPPPPPAPEEAAPEPAPEAAPEGTPEVAPEGVPEEAPAPEGEVS